MKQILLTLILTLIASTTNAETIKLGGSGSMIPLLNDLAKAYTKKNPSENLDIAQKSMGQPGGVAALNAGAIDIAMSAMPLTDDQKRLAITPYEIATVAGVVAVSKDVTVPNLTSQQLCDIYAGKITSWKQVGGADAKIQVFTRPESDSTKIMFRKGFACMQNLAIAKDTMNLAKSAEMFTALETKQNAIGIVDAIAFHDSIGKFKAIKVDGNSFDSGKWNFILRNNLVAGKTMKPAVKKFLEFVKSPDGQAVIKANKSKPIPFNL